MAKLLYAKVGGASKLSWLVTQQMQRIWLSKLYLTTGKLRLKSSDRILHIVLLHNARRCASLSRGSAHSLYGTRYSALPSAHPVMDML